MTTYVLHFDNPDAPWGTTDDARIYAEADSQYLEEQLGIAPSFWDDVFEHASDWAFVIQLHALLEAGMTDVLASADRMRRERDSRMRIGQMRDQLIRLDKLGNLGAEFVATFSSIRNDFVHDVRKVYASLTAEFETLSREQLRKIIEPSIRGTPLPEYAIDDAHNWPRELLMFGCMNVLQEITS